MAMTSTGRRIRKRKLKAEINVVPYIDVMLVLLIIFMVTRRCSTSAWTSTCRSRGRRRSTRRRSP